MSDLEVKQYINDLIDKLRIMRKTTSYKNDIDNYIEALKIVYAKVNQDTYKDVLSGDGSAISMDDLLAADSSAN